MVHFKQSEFREIRKQYSGVQKSYNDFQREYRNIEETGDLLTYWDMLSNANLLWGDLKDIEYSLNNISSKVKLETPKLMEEYTAFLDNIREWKNDIKYSFRNGISTLKSSHPFDEREQQCLNSWPLYHESFN